MRRVVGKSLVRIMDEAAGSNIYGGGDWRAVVAIFGTFAFGVMLVALENTLSRTAFNWIMGLGLLFGFVMIFFVLDAWSARRFKEKREIAERLKRSKGGST